MILYCSLKKNQFIYLTFFLGEFFCLFVCCVCVFCYCSNLLKPPSKQMKKRGIIEIKHNVKPFKFYE